MSSVTQVSRAAVAAAFLASLVGCSDEPSGSAATTSHSAAVTTTTAAATATAMATATATATASATVTRPCPKGATGEGSLKAPCESKGKERMMEVTWTGKMDDNGPSFRIVNKGTETILFGKIVVYFYDKAGKLIEIKDEGGKSRPNHVCSGNLFSGIMKSGEKAVVTFSCVGKKIVPEGAVAIEGEMQVVGFADASEKRSDLFWRNTDLTPDNRPKGGIK